MTDHAAFLRAVVESPDDDLPRLVYADWLDEHGEAVRAEVIRLGCNRGARFRAFNMSRLLPQGRGSYSRECIAQWRRQNVGFPPKGFAAMVRSMLPPPPAGPYGESNLCEVVFVRGFPSRFRCPWSWWQAHAAALLAACPIANANDGCVRLTTWPAFGRLDQLDSSRWRGRLVMNGTAEINTVETLAGEWPGIHFEFPRTWRPVGDARVRPDHTAAR